MRDAELPNITLAWMVNQLSPFLDFDPAYLAFSHKVNAQFYADRADGTEEQVSGSKTAGDSKERFVEGPKWGMGYIPENQVGSLFPLASCLSTNNVLIGALILSSGVRRFTLLIPK